MYQSDVPIRRLGEWIDDEVRRAFLTEGIDLLTRPGLAVLRAFRQTPQRDPRLDVPPVRHRSLGKPLEEPGRSLVRVDLDGAPQHEVSQWLGWKKLVTMDRPQPRHLPETIEPQSMNFTTVGRPESPVFFRDAKDRKVVKGFQRSIFHLPRRELHRD
jgi:hypothetical protein